MVTLKRQLCFVPARADSAKNCYYFEAEPGSEFDLLLQQMSNPESTADWPGDGQLDYAYTPALSRAEALAEFAFQGNCDSELRLRLIVRQTIQGGGNVA